MEDHRYYQHWQLNLTRLRSGLHVLQYGLVDHEIHPAPGENELHRSLMQPWSPSKNWSSNRFCIRRTLECPVGSAIESGPSR